MVYSVDIWIDNLKLKLSSETPQAVFFDQDTYLHTHNPKDVQSLVNTLLT